MSGLWSRGYNGDCRDCAYYRDNFIAQSIKMDISAITQVNILMIGMANNAIVSTT